MSEKIFNEVSDYYSEKVQLHGDTPQGVDWNGEESQYKRFDQLSRIITNPKEGYSIADLGCGYAALYDFLVSKKSSFNYIGYDVSKEMVEAAKSRIDGNNIELVHSEKIASNVSYGIASGIFNVRLKTSNKEWLDYIISVLDNMNEYCEKGFSFNCLTSYSDDDKMKDYLYYANPMELFDLCKRKYSRNVALLHDYDLYEFTILVRK